MSQPRYFTVAEAEALIPRLEGILGRVLQLHRELRGVAERLEGLGQPPTAELVEGQAPSGDPQVARLQMQFKGLYEAIGDEVRNVEAIGGHVKDLEIGLVDFYSLRAGKDQVLLCWRLGEKRIEFWHDLESGFGGRKPVDGESFVGDQRALH